jgi:hypothetical protein
MRLLLGVLGFLLLTAGCRPAGPKSQNRFSRPPDGTVRVLFTKISPERLKWSLIGERNWRRATAQDATASLADVYPLNATDQRGGCNTWELDLTVQKDRWKLRVHGSNGFTATSEVPKGPGDELTLRVDTDTELRLPADTTLAELGKTPLRLQLAR